MRILRNGLILGIINVLLCGCSSVIRLDIRIPQETVVIRENIKTLAVLKFNDPLSTSSDQIVRNEFVEQLASGKYFRLKSDKETLMELSAYLGDIEKEFSSKEAIEVGKKLGVDAVFYGDIGECRVDTKQKSTDGLTSVDKTGFFCIKYYLARVSSGDLVLVSSGTFENKIKPLLSPEGEIKYPSDRAALEKIIKGAVNSIIKDITPVFLSVNRNLVKGRNTETFKGFIAAKSGDWSKAMALWERVISVDPYDHYAHNNLGIAYEREGWTAQAEEEYDKAIGIDPENRYYIENLEKLKTKG